MQPSIGPSALRRGGHSGARSLALVASLAALGTLTDQADAKTPGKEYCFNGICHRVKTIAETSAAIGKTMVLQASYYDEAGKDAYNPSNVTSSGEYFRADRSDNAASPVLPDGTKVLVWHPGTRKAAIVRINNAGPYHGRRMIDLSRAAAEKLGFASSGVATLHARVLAAPTRDEASYRSGRKYAPVPGFIGAFGNVELAMADAARALGIGGATLVAAATPTPPARTPAIAGTAVAAVEPSVPARAQPTASMAAAQTAAVTPGLAMIADAGDRQAAAGLEARRRVTREAIQALADERRRVAEQKQTKVAEIAARAEAKERNIAAERAAESRSKRTDVALAKTDPPRERRRPRPSDDAPEASAAKPQAQSQSQSQRQARGSSEPGSSEQTAVSGRQTLMAAAEPEMSWVKTALRMD